MNPFQNLSNTGLEAPKDTLGGGGFGAIDSDVYTGTIKALYAGKSQGGAHNVTAVLALVVNGQPREYRETIYVTNKQGENFYTDKQDSTKKSPLPGFTTANDLALMTTGKGLNEQSFEERVINVYNYDQQKELPTKVAMAVDMIGKPVTVAIQKSLEPKNVKDASGNYVPDPSGATRETNNIDKVFHAESGRTVSEVLRKLEKGEFIDQWREKNKGQVRDKTKGKTPAGTGVGIPGLTGAPAAAGGAQSTNIFGA